MLERFVTEDGSHSLRSERFGGVTYHSLHGAVQEARVVFIDSGLFYKGRIDRELDILEIGLGTGLNALMSLMAAETEGFRLRYTGVEAYPLNTETAAELNYPEVLGRADLRAAFLQMHASADRWLRLSPKFEFFKSVRNFKDLDYKQAFDLIYYDAFAPAAQPELWEEAQLSRMFAALRPGGVLTTYCAKGSFKRALKAVGFRVEALPGPPGKREMTRAFV